MPAFSLGGKQVDFRTGCGYNTGLYSKAMMGTSMLPPLSANPEVVRAGPVNGAENPPGAANWNAGQNLFCPGISEPEADRYPGRVSPQGCTWSSACRPAGIRVVPR